jgi:hypothetical protein
MPPAPLGTRYQREINAGLLSRAVNSLFVLYDDIKFEGLSWAYWHALCATMHIAGVHFGSAIEALQRRYVEIHPGAFETTLVTDRDAWKALADEFRLAISKLAIPEENKKMLSDNVGNVNRTPQRVIIERFLMSINIQLGADEKQAWRRRNDAAHGNELKSGSELQIIRDTQLLKILFHRILMRVTNATDTYYDYCTPGFPVRNLSDSVPSVP